MSIASIVTRGYGTYGSINELAVRGYSTGVIQIDVCAMTMTCQNFTAGDTGVSWIKRMSERVIGWITPNKRHHTRRY